MPACVHVRVRVDSQRAACEAMCSPSASNAIEPNSTPATISTTIIVAVIAITSCVLRSPGRR